jgi:nucleoid-associated protein YgaU
MGLFDFFRDAGDDLTETVEVSPQRLNELRRESILEKVAQLDIDGEQVNVSVDGEKATLIGTVPSQEALEKIVLCAGNQHGIAQVDCQLSVDAPASAAASPTGGTPAGAPAGSASSGSGSAPAAPATPPAEAASTFYTVKSGDTLGKIAKEHYGDAGKYMVIFEANQPMLKDPDKIYPGQSLRLPPL